MQSQNPFLDDLARLAGGALGAVSGLKAEADGLLRQQMERFMASANMVPREEFDVMRDMLIKARCEQDALATRLAEVEAKLEALTLAAQK